MYHNGTWGTVCDDGFTDAAARVVCYSLGFGYVTTYVVFRKSVILFIECSVIFNKDRPILNLITTS